MTEKSEAPKKGPEAPRERPSEAEAGFRERLQQDPEAAIDDLAEEVTDDMLVFGEETGTLSSKAEKAAGAPLDEEALEEIDVIDEEAEQAAAAAKDRLAEAKKEVRESRTVTRQFEYRDKEGRLLGLARVEIEPAARRLNVRGQEGVLFDRVKSLRIVGEKDGQPTEFDLLAAAGIPDADVIVMSPGETADVPPAQKIIDGQVVVRLHDLPDNPASLAVMMHEIGHAKQAGEAGYGDIRPAWTEAAVQWATGSFDWAMSKRIIAELEAAFPEARNLMDDATRADLDQDGYLEAVAEEARLKEAYAAQEKANPDKRLLRAARESWAAADKTKKEWEEKLAPAIHRAREVTFMVVKILENDASLRALDWMKQAKAATGVDLFAPVKVTADKLARDANCGSADEMIETSAEEEIIHGLESYRVPTKKPKADSTT